MLRFDPRMRQMSSLYHEGVINENEETLDQVNELKYEENLAVIHKNVEVEIAHGVQF